MKLSSVSRVLCTTSRDFGLFQNARDPVDASANQAIRKRATAANDGWDSRQLMLGKSIRTDHGIVIGEICDVIVSVDQTPSFAIVKLTRQQQPFQPCHAVVAAEHLHFAGGFLVTGEVDHFPCSVWRERLVKETTASIDSKASRQPTVRSTTDAASPADALLPRSPDCPNWFARRWRQTEPLTSSSSALTDRRYPEN